MEQQTAVEFYDQALRKCLMGTVECDPNQILEQANQLFREQIIRARQDGLDNGFSNGSWDSNLYYNETYNK
jgi:hypothetical protein